jgi:hypothetical protein
MTVPSLSASIVADNAYGIKPSGKPANQLIEEIHSPNVIKSAFMKPVRLTTASNP